MQRLHGWVRYAAEGLSQRAGTPQQQQQPEDEEDFIYARVQVHSDDEDAGPARRASSRRISAPASTAPNDNEPISRSAAPEQHQPTAQHAQLPAVQLMHLHSHSDGELLHLDVSGQHQLHNRQQQNPGIDDLLQFEDDSDNQNNTPAGGVTKLGSAGAGWEADWAAEFAGRPGDSSSNLAGHPSNLAGQPSNLAGHPSNLAGSSNPQQQLHQQQAADPSINSSSRVQQEQERIDSSSRPSTPAADVSRTSSSGGGGLGAQDSSKDNDPGEIPDHEHSYKRQELIIYVIPLTRGKVIFLPVCPWRTEPEQQKGLKKAIAGHVGKVQGEASDLWQRMAAAEQGTFVNRVYKLGKRVLDSISPEERLMRGVPKDISKVVIHHPTQVPPDTIMQQMQTMTKSYGIKAVGKAAAATLMLPLAVGVDLIILPGPQVLTYYTMWELYRNTNGALGTTRMTKFITQGGNSENIRVNYMAESRLDKYYDLANDCPEGVLSEDNIEQLVADLREPDLADALLSLRNKALRESGMRTSKGGDEYVALPPTDPAVADAFGSSQGHQAGGGSSANSRRVSMGW